LDPQEAATEKSKRDGGEISVAPMKLTETNFAESDEEGDDGLPDDLRHAVPVLTRMIRMKRIGRIRKFLLVGRSLDGAVDALKIHRRLFPGVSNQLRAGFSDRR
jgi:hypothetical protein